jgi:hypothetical protein
MKIDIESDNVARLPVQKKEHDKTITLAPDRWSGCQHVRAIVDEKLAELTCADCQAKLNPIQFLAMLANQSTRWDWELDRIVKARAALEERKFCRCKRCGEMTPIERVSRPWVRRHRKRTAAPPQKEII